ncbi:chromatin associated protein KTI12 [Echria macrotheca]|uniref:Chromatin associated protein KTI12 n=1 Tax=Echria macrotheca TaxID=438768 RepID=A0AAJ0B345_9PEZI|nr:chromatin associated protein KTI12 [Echria macrotheca]
MPLIIITGLPTSGKTTRARQLHAYLADRIASSPQNPPYRLHLISDQTQDISRTVYDLSPTELPAHVRSANASEKDARAALYGAVKRVLSPRDVVILDGLNYIKGWRYQLYCEAKNARTPHCVVQVGCSVEQARQVNEARLARRAAGTTSQSTSTPPAPADTASSSPTDDTENGGATMATEPPTDTKTETNPQPESDENDNEDPYTPSNWENLVYRYEEPNPMTRWDSPLFTLIWTDTPSQITTTFSQIWDSIAGPARKLIRPNQSTVQRDKDPGGDYLYVLERETHDIVKTILEKQSDDGEGGAVDVGDGLVVELPTGRKLAMPQLMRLKRAFVALNRGGIGLEAVGKLDVRRLRESFVGYLNDAFEKDG